jgi:hypothetical protein
MFWVGLGETRQSVAAADPMAFHKALGQVPFPHRKPKDCGNNPLRFDDLENKAMIRKRSDVTGIDHFICHE